MTNTPLLKPITYLVALAMICFSIGCEQQRYSPSTWTPAAGSNGTLPGVGQLGPEGNRTLPGRDGTLPGRGDAGTLPGRNFVSLPWRAGGQSSLPVRTGTGTLPGRSPIVVSRPKKKQKPALPSLDGKPVWDVTEKRQMQRAPGKPGLYMGQDNPLAGLSSNAFRQGRSGSTLPARGSTLPMRGGSTLPFRGFNSSTLPGR